jgi:PAS domain S-box-containing protein
MAERQSGESGRVAAGAGSGDSADLRQRIAQLEAQLRDTQALYSTLVETVPLYVFRKDADGHVTFGNQLYCEALGMPLEELIGLNDLDLFPVKLAEKYRQDDLKVIESGETFHDIEEHVNPGRCATAREKSLACRECIATSRRRRALRPRSATLRRDTIR